MSATTATKPLKTGDKVSLELLGSTQFYKELGTHDKIELSKGTFAGEIVPWDNTLYVKITLKAGFGYKSLGDVLQLCREDMKCLRISKV